MEDRLYGASLPSLASPYKRFFVSSLKPVAFISQPPTGYKNRDGTDNPPDKGQDYISHQSQHYKSDPEHLASHG